MKIIRLLLVLLSFGSCTAWISAQSSVVGVVQSYANGSISTTVGTVKTVSTIDGQGSFSVPVPSNSSPYMVFTPVPGSPYYVISLTVYAGPGTTNITTQVNALITPYGINIGIPNLGGVATDNRGFAIPGSAGGTYSGTSPIQVSGTVISCPTCGTSLATVQSVAIGNLPPLFTTTVANPTTTASGTYSLSNAAQNSFFAGPASGGTGAPSYRAIAAADIPNSLPAVSIGGNAATATAAASATNAINAAQLAATPTQCSTGNAPTGILPNGNATGCASLAGGAVSSVSNSDSSVTVSPTTGAVVVSLNLGHANVYTTPQSAPSYVTTGSTQGADVLGVGTGTPSMTNWPTNFAGWMGPATGTPTYVATLPNANPSTAAIMVLGPAATVNGVSQAPVSTIAGTTTTVLHGNASGAPSYGQVVAADLAPQYSKGSCTEAWGGSGTSFALTSGDDAISDNTCYNDSGVTRTITAVKCRSDIGSNTTTVNPTFGSAGAGTTILSGALTCGSSLAYSSTGTVSNASWTTGSGINPAMGGTLTGTSIALIVEYTY